jgi:AcrR family transcriptional regulator
LPRIKAATVAENRVAQRAALIEAARELLAERPDRAPSLTEVAARAEMARPTVYQYFASGADLFDAVVADLFPRWSRRLDSAMRGARTPGERVLAYVDANLRLVADGEHAIARSLATFASSSFDVNGDRHATLVKPLTDALRDLGARDPETTADMINGIVYTASHLIESGTSLRTARARAHELLDPYVATSER